MAGYIYQYRSGADWVDSFMLMGFHAATVSPVEPALKYSERQTGVGYFLGQRKDNIKSNLLEESSPLLVNKKRKDELNHCCTPGQDTCNPFRFYIKYTTSNFSQFCINFIVQLYRGGFITDAKT